MGYSLLLLISVLLFVQSEAVSIRSVLRRIGRVCRPPPRHNNNWQNEEVIKAEYVERPLQAPFANNMVNHHGIKLTTKEGNQWLLHYPKNKLKTNKYEND